ncbi:MAG: DUF4367 domain-containing protein [Firmicutes bacterium]|nr:DUF4367 domain-containing protein [Bacillota bacterium]
MMHKEKDAERMAEEIMQAFGKKLGEARADYCEALMDPDREDPPLFTEDERLMTIDPDLEAWLAGFDEDCGDGANNLPPAAEILDFSQWKQIQVDKEKIHKRRNGKLRRVLILAAVLILMMSLVLAAAEGVKLKRSSMYMSEDAGNSTRIIDMDKAEFDVEDFNVTYVPEGYELVEDVVYNTFTRKLIFAKSKEERFQVIIAKTDNYGANVDNEKAGRKEVLVNDKQAYVFEDSNTGFILWQMGDCTLDIVGRLSEEELVEIASHVFVD